MHVADASQHDMVEELKRKLIELQQNVVAGGAQAKNTELKEALKRKKKKAEQKISETVKKAREKGDDENVFDEIYGTLQVRSWVFLYFENNAIYV